MRIFLHNFLILIFVTFYHIQFIWLSCRFWFNSRIFNLSNWNFCRYDIQCHRNRSFGKCNLKYEDDSAIFISATSFIYHDDNRSSKSIFIKVDTTFLSFEKYEYKLQAMHHIEILFCNTQFEEVQNVLHKLGNWRRTLMALTGNCRSYWMIFYTFI